MTCKNCGSKNNSDSTYCSNCGNLVDEALYTRKKKELQIVKRGSTNPQKPNK